MKKDLLEVVKKFDNIIILSPHTDDAVLSCGSLLTKLAGKKDITVVNIFSNANKKPYTVSARKFMKYSLGYSDSTKLYTERINEDKKVLSQFSIEPIDLGLPDALFRRKKKQVLLGKYIAEFDHVYPTYRFHILGKISQDDEALSVLRKKLAIYNNKKTLIFAPFGIGNHVDHRIVRMVSEELFANLILYSDFPYNVRTGSYGDADKNQYIIRLKPDVDKKNMVLKGYKTQFSGLFPQGQIPNHEEVYFVPNNL